jgi:hypothetical protein
MRLSLCCADLIKLGVLSVFLWMQDLKWGGFFWILIGIFWVVLKLLGSSD